MPLSVIYTEPPCDPDAPHRRHLHARLDAIELALEAIQASLDGLSQSITHNQETTMATLADVTTALQGETDAETAVETLLDAISAQLKTALQGNDPAALQAIVQQLNDNKAKLAAAVVANTPAGPVVTPTVPGNGGGGVVTSPTVSGGATGTTSVGSGTVTVPGAPGETPTTPGVGSATLPSGATVLGANSSR